MHLDIQHDARTRALRSTDHLRSGPFVIRFDADWATPFANYAIPDDGAQPTAADIDALVLAFRDRERLPRLEYLPACAPQVEPALLAAGFVAENRAAVMACAAGSLRPPAPVPGLAVREPADEAGLLAAATVQHHGYGQPGEPGAGETDWLRRTLSQGGLVALATGTDGRPVGAGVCSPPLDGLSELAGLAVAAEFRGRGAGAALSAWLTAAALERGRRTVWLEPADPDVERMYARIGYRTVGEKLNISLPR